MMGSDLLSIRVSFYTTEGALRSLPEIVDEARRDYLLWALTLCKGNILKTATLLRVTPRQVYRGIEKYRIDLHALRVDTHV